MENKRAYIKPILESETFVPQNYIAACGDLNKVYKFKCDAGGGKSGSVYLETNGTSGLQTGWGGDRYLSGYHACGTTHEAKSTDAFLNGYYVTTDKVWVPGGWFGGHWEEKKVTTPVIVWRGPHNDNTHCTENLDMDSWETAKS